MVFYLIKSFILQNDFLFLLFFFSFYCFSRCYIRAQKHHDEPLCLCFMRSWLLCFVHEDTWLPSTGWIKSLLSLVIIWSSRFLLVFLGGVKCKNFDSVNSKYLIWSSWHIDIVKSLIVPELPLCLCFIWQSKCISSITNYLNFFYIKLKAADCTMIMRAWIMLWQLFLSHVIKFFSKTCNEAQNPQTKLNLLSYPVYV